MLNGAPFIFVDKPAGVTTHSSRNKEELLEHLGSNRDGFCESLSERLKQHLYVVHRLDQDTTGCLCFARDKATAAELAELFAGRQVHKTYLFLTDRSLSASQFSVTSHIERRGTQYVSNATEPNHNAVTHFRKIKESHGITLWEARPETGRPHQIRLHAQDSKIPVLGDLQHGGSNFPGLCLHSQTLEFSLTGQNYTFFSRPPLWFDDLSLISDHLLCRWLASTDRRQRLLHTWELLGDPLDSNDTRTLRWIHTEGDPLRVDQFGRVFTLSWYSDTPSPSQWASLHKLIETMKWGTWYLQVRGDRGRSPNTEAVFYSQEDWLPRWQAKENGVNYEVRTDSGLSAGLFLDQRRNRLWVKEHTRGKTVLNLFSYTSGFSVAAALGGASKVVSVDVSKSFLEWSKTNFTLNGLSLAQHEFRTIDCREYLSWAKKKSLRFDLVICDPPSFGRSKSGVFRIEKDFPELMTALLEVTAPGGRILFSNNVEKWTLQDFTSRTMTAAKNSGHSVRLIPTPSADWDFEVPRELPILKSFFVERL